MPAEDAPSETEPAALFSTLTAPVEFSDIEFAVMLPAPTKLMPPVPAVRLTLAAVRMSLLLMPEAAPLPVRVNEDADDDPRLIIPLNVSATLTAPVELIVNAEALSDLAPVKDTPALPALRLTVPEFKAPAAVIPLAAPLATKLNDEPEDAFRVMPPLLVSTMLTAPVELAASVVADTVAPDAKLIPPVPALIVKLGDTRE